MYSYSRRLPWSLPSNALSKSIEEKRRRGVPLLDLTISNPTAVFGDYPHAAIARAYGCIHSFEYYPNPAGVKEARSAVAQFYESRKIAIPEHRVLLTASTSEAYALLFKLFCNPEDEILVPVPSYPLFEYLAALEAVRIVPYRLGYDGSWFIDFDDLQKGLSSRTRAIVVVNPNNPTGSFLKEREAERLLEAALRHRIPIVSDEVFMDYSFGSARDCKRTLIGEDSVLSFSLNGLSKTAGMPQVKLGWIAVNGPEEEAEMARARLELLLDTYLSVSAAAQYALPELLEIGTGIGEQILARAKRNFETANQLLNCSAAQCLRTEGGWSTIIRLPNALGEDAWVSRLLDEQGIIVQPGYFFDMPSEAYVVVSLITPPEDFAEGIVKLRDLVGTLNLCEQRPPLL